MKTQIIIIHGGDTFATHEEYLTFLGNYEIESLDYFRKKGWKSSLQEKLGESFDVIIPKMPCAINAKYEEWKIWFEKLSPLLNDEVILIGHSLGGIFLAKYLSENDFSKKILSLHLVAAPYDEETSQESLVDFALSKTVESLPKRADKIFLYHSQDDLVVPFVDVEKYQRDLPSAKLIVFEDRGHFNQEEFPELVKRVKNCL